jgi:hypothetical protein
MAKGNLKWEIINQLNQATWNPVCPFTTACLAWMSMNCNQSTDACVALAAACGFYNQERNAGDC